MGEAYSEGLISGQKFRHKSKSPWYRKAKTDIPRPRRLAMVKFIPWEQILARLVEEQKIIPALAEVLQGIYQAGSARWHIACHMQGRHAAAYKRLQRLVASFDPRSVLARLCLDEAPFVLLDPTEISRPQARKTTYVGRLPEGKRGFWLLVLATPFRGRALPCGWLTYSSATIAEESTSQPLEVRRLSDEAGNPLHPAFMASDHLAGS